MNENKIVLYDDALLRRERGIKIANVVIAVFFMLDIIPILVLICNVSYRMSETVALDKMSGIISKVFFAILLFLLLEHINNIHLKHIASIKLYKNRNEG